MPLPGGPADKLGNRYELWWTTLQVLNVLQGQWDSIRVEVPGNEKVEFELVCDHTRAFHQAKMSAPGGKWSLAELASPSIGVLQSVADYLKWPDNRYVFVSSSDSRELAELSDRSRASASVNEFSKVFTSGRQLQQQLSRLQKCWNNCDLATARDYLCRIEVRVIDERSLKEQAMLGAQILFLAPPAKVCSEIRTLIVDSVHRTLTREAIVEHLKQAGYVLRQIVSIDRAKPLVEEVTRAYLSGTHSRLIQGTLVPRDVTNQLTEIIGSTGSDCVLTGRAGAGKTGCITEFVHKLESEQIPVLAFRLDRVDPVASTADLGRKLGLGESPALVLAAAAKNYPSAVLVIDQLDAISTTSGRTASFFDTVDALLNEVRGLRSRVAMHIVLVCREFDWKNDHRLRKLLATGHNHIAIGDFTRDQVSSILRTAGYAPESIPARTLELLCLPQNLSLFLESSIQPNVALNTTLDLFHEYWKTKRQSVNKRAAPTQDCWILTIRTLVDGMTESQQLSIRREMLDQIPPDYVEQMVSEGVISLSGNRLGFGHESFFDYCFARQFVVSSQSLVDFLRAHEQHLFRRAQVRQVLQYLHDGEPARFCKELEQLVTETKIRTHLKDLALAVAAASTKISEPEWDLWTRLIEPHLVAVREGRTADVVSTLAWRHFSASGSLFEQALQRGVARAWLEAENDSVVDLGVWYLRMHEARFSAEAAGLLRPFRGNAAWHQRLLWFMQLVDLNGSRQMFHLFLDLIEDGTLDEARGVIAANSTFWSLLYRVAERSPESVCEIVAAWLRRQLYLAHEKDSGEHLFRFQGDQFADDPISKAARSAPERYVSCVLPIIVETSSWAAYSDSELPRRDRVWPYLMAHDLVQEPHNAALAHLQEALETVSSTSPEKLQGYVDSLKQKDTYIATVLLMCIFAGNGKYFSAQAVDLFTKQPWRFECGLADNPYWFAQKAIKSVSTNASVEELADLELTILKYVARWEKTAAGYRYHGNARFNLLAAIPVERRSHRANRAFRELKRKFGEPSGEPEGVRGGVVGPPIPEDRLEKMDDDAIFAAIAHYTANERPRDYRNFLKGGNLQLARAVAAMAAKQPDRIAQLALRLPRNTSPEYFAELLRALQKAPVEDALKLKFAANAFANQRESCGGEIADMLGVIEDPLPQKSLEQLCWLALYSPDPSQDAWRKQSANGANYHEGDPFNYGISTTRGRAALAIGTLINHDPQYVERFGHTIQKMTEEPNEGVLACTAFTLRALAVRDYPYAWNLFERCCVNAPELPSSQYGFDLIRVGIGAHFALVRRQIEQLLRNPEQRAIELGSQLACIAALMHPEAEEMAEAAVNGNEIQRLAAARVAAANLGGEEFRPWCERHLIRFFNDPDKKVRQEAGDCFRHLTGLPLESFASLIDAYCKSAAFEDNSHSLLYALEESVERIPGVVCTACELFLRRFGPEARDIRTHRAADGYTVTKLIFRVYHQHQQDRWGPRTLDIIDRLCQEGVGEVMAQLQQFDR